MIAVLLLTLPSFVYAQAPRVIGPALVFSTEGEFDLVKQDLLAAIEGHGMVISYTSHASTMLDRTAAAIGGAPSVYGKAEIVMFCKADLSHRLVAANPHNIVLCPYAISVYTLSGENGRVYLGIRQPFMADVYYAPIHRLLIDIITETIDG